jgi:hypothetical protein
MYESVVPTDAAALDTFLLPSSLPLFFFPLIDSDGESTKDALVLLVESEDPLVLYLALSTALSLANRLAVANATSG